MKDWFAPIVAGQLKEQEIAQCIVLLVGKQLGLDVGNETLECSEDITKNQCERFIYLICLMGL